MMPMQDFLEEIEETGAIAWTRQKRVLFERAVEEGLIQRNQTMLCPTRYQLTAKGKATCVPSSSK